MNKKQILILLSPILLFSCNIYTPPKDIFNYHLTSQLGYEFTQMPGVHKIEEVHEVADTENVSALVNLLPVKFDPTTKYSHQYNKDGTIHRTFLNYDLDRAVRFEYGSRKELFSIAGYYPGYVKEIFEYHKDNFIKYIFREHGEDILYKYTEDHKTVSCYSFRPIRDGSKRALKPEKLLYQILLKSYEDGSFVVQVKGASDGKEIEKYTYEATKLVKKEAKGIETIVYKYDDNDNIYFISHEASGKNVINYHFDYKYDKKGNWIDRQIKLDDKMILETERTIKYY